MNVYLGTPRGFCAGVVMAIDVVEIALERFGAPVYMKHQIVHNPHVVDALESKGAKTVEEVDEIPPDSVVVFSAHGSPPEDFERAKDRDLHVLDATCPLVTKVHNEAKRYDREGRKLIIVGHRGHQEVRGTMGHRPMFLIDERDGINLPEWNDDTPVTVLTQTTLSVDDTLQVIDEIEDSFDNVIVRNDLCYATTNRQFAVKELCKLVDLVLVIGAPNSSNCNRLREVANAQGVPAHLINSPEELRRRVVRWRRERRRHIGSLDPGRARQRGRGHHRPRQGDHHSRRGGGHPLQAAQGAVLRPPLRALVRIVAH